jgi:hypothetical protein
MFPLFDGSREIEMGLGPGGTKALSVQLCLSRIQSGSHTAAAKQFAEKLSPGETSNRARSFSRAAAIGKQSTSTLPTACAQPGSPASAGVAVAGVRSSRLWSEAHIKEQRMSFSAHFKATLFNS